MGRPKKPLEPGEKKPISKTERVVLSIPTSTYLYFQVLKPKYGRSESEILMRLVEDFIETHRKELEKNECRTKLKKLEDELAEAQAASFEDELEDYDFEN